MYLRKVICFISCISLFSCSESKITLEKRTPQIKINYNFNLSDKNDQVNFDFSIWMFKNNNNPDKNSIANWLNIAHQSKTILEPINVLWIDFRAKTKSEAINNNIKFLTLNNFLMRSGSSKGYFGFFENKEWIEQYKDTWSDKKDPLTINNHGRTFLAHKVISKSGNTVFISSGAFSIESEKHLFVSFNDALKQFNEVDDWWVYKENMDVGNLVEMNNYSTFDHKGVKVFVLN